MTTSVNTVIGTLSTKEAALGVAVATTDAAKQGQYLSWETEGNVSQAGKMGLQNPTDIMILVQASTPSDNSVTAPAAATFRTVANSIPTDTLTYQWHWSNGLAVAANSIMTGVTASNLVITNSTGLNGKRFYCVVAASIYSGSAQTAVANLTVA